MNGTSIGSTVALALVGLTAWTVAVAQEGPRERGKPVFSELPCAEREGGRS